MQMSGSRAPWVSAVLSSLVGIPDVNVWFKSSQSLYDDNVYGPLLVYSVLVHLGFSSSHRS